MKIFLSSLISGFEPYRAAARAAVESLGHEAIMAEDFGSQANSPQVACLQGLRASHLVVLLLGARYGSLQPGSGLSPTHEEFTEARGLKPILLFVEDGVAYEPAQQALVTEAQGWESGLFRDGFKNPEELRALITRAIHRHELAHAAAPLDVESLKAAVQALLASSGRDGRSGSPFLRLAFAGGPRSRILRPAQLEADEIADVIHQQAMFGTEPRLFDRGGAVHRSIDDEALVVRQESGAMVKLNENADIELCLPLERSQGRSGMGGLLQGIIEENVLRELRLGVGFANWLFDHVDSTRRLTHVGIGARIEAANYMGWRTQAEQNASPNTRPMRASESPAQTVLTDRPRAALKFDEAVIGEDLMVPLRRQWKI